MNTMTEQPENEMPARNSNKSEFRRAVLRMGSNYIRLFLSVAIGLMLVRLILEHWGNDAWALIALIGGTLGIAAMLQDVVRQSMIRELASSLHSEDPIRFLSMYNSALLVTAGVGVITFLLVIVIALILPLLNTNGMLEVARWIVIAKGIETVVAIFLGAPMNMYVATERMALSNMWIVAQRLCPIIAVLWVIMVMGVDDPVLGLKYYAVISASIFIIVNVVAVVTIVCMDNRLFPRLKYISKSALRELLHIGGWNAVAVTSLGMHIRIDSLLMNIFFLLPGSLIYGFTSQLTSYVRMLAMGVSYGLDAVSTRVSSRKGDEAVRELCTHITRLNSAIALPAAAALFVMAGPILSIWVGDRMENPETDLPLTVVLVRVMCIGMVIRAMTDGWIKILYGAGHVRKYAPLILGGVIVNPILAVILYYTLPESMRFVFAVTSYSLVYIVANLGILPRIMGRIFGGGAMRILAPTVRPLIATLVSALLLAYAIQFIEQWTILELMYVSAGYGALYVAIVWIIVLRTDERQLAVRMVKKRIPF
jgi:O-antigen/teichoic acid export membrane protein